MSAVLLIVAVLLAFLYFYLHKNTNLPPGPIPWPILGNFPPIIIAGWRGTPSVEVFKRWHRKYGNVYTFWMGPIATVHVVDYRTAVEAYVKNSDVHAGRMHMWQLELTRGNKGLVFSDGQEWIEQRRFTLHVLRDFGVGKNLMEEKILDEIRYRFADLEDELNANNGRIVTDLAPFFDLLIGSIINNVLVGYRFDESRENEFFSLKHNLDKQISGASMIDHVLLTPTTIKWPWFRNRWDKWLEPMRFANGFIRKSIDERIDSIERGAYQLDDSGHGNDYIDAYLIEMNRRRRSGEHLGSFSIDNLVHNMADLWMAGMETTVLTLLWGFIFFLNDLSVQDTLRAEIGEITNGQRFVKMSDRASLPYASAVVTEVHRCSRLANFTLFHRTTEDCLVGGYKIAAGTLTVPQFSVISHDEDVFDRPDTFNPDRFMGENRKELEQNVAIFGLGKRACLGEGLARAELFLTITNMIQRFKFSVVPGELPPTRKAESDGVSMMNRPRRYRIQIEKCE